ncbi:Cell division protein FtsQ [Sodalis glossinidius str. 'morsitans']|uniref:Cell division protein FtsQ n=1 Tax=Sodalis glossinidius (strain morsitans) TaxID=343509 RepID=Q2NVU9_SODGM|nr:cell division protein FtsQ [Sodalis glossinidius]BAE73726.1 cell division protein FtsQ [Sodalis glossinidius str. 'morsitans']CRL44135.1 Cell division protein FtsQ [Sodalis glossinidius str. 'morsitans']
MSQAAINVRNRETERAAAGRSNGGQLAGLIFLLMVLGTIVWGGWMVVGWMKDAHRLPLSRLVVTGYRHYTTNDDIRQAILALGAPGTFMTQDVNVIQQQIERMPWIKQVSVRKQWPDELKIHLVEYVPVVRWNDQHLLDGSGKVFSAPAERIGNQPMPMLYGPEGSEQDVLSGYRTMNAVLTAAKFQLKAVSMSARHSWQLTLRDDTRLELGRDDRARRLQRFIGIYPVLLQQARNDNKRISYVDLRYDSGLAVGWAAAYIEPENSNQQQIQAQAEQQ